MRDLIASSGDGAFAVDPTQTIVLWNDAASEVLGYRRDDVLGKKCFRVFRRGPSEACPVCRPDCDLMRAAKCLRPVAARTIAVRTADGTTAWLNVSSLALPTRSGTLRALVHLFRDVTRDHRLLQIAREFVGAATELTEKKPNGAPRDPVCVPPHIRLTRRQKQVLRLLSAGDNTAAIATQLCISPRTVSNHVTAILDKLGVHSRLEAVTYFIRNGLI